MTATDRAIDAVEKEIETLRGAAGSQDRTGINARDRLADLYIRVLKRKVPGMVLVRSAGHRHRVHVVDGKPAWSLVFTSGKKRSWGFWREGGFIPWRQFIAKKCADQKTGAA